MDFFLSLFLALILTIIVEFLVYYLYFKFLSNGTYPSTYLMTSIFINILTNPLVNIINLFLFPNIFVLEVLVFIFEAIPISGMLNLSWKDGFVLSFLANLSSYFCGILFFSILV